MIVIDYLGLVLSQEGCIENGRLKALPNDVYNEGCVVDVMDGIKVCASSSFCVQFVWTCTFGRSYFHRKSAYFGSV